MRYVLKNQGYPFKFIYAARRKVGRVYRHTDGHYVGMIGRTVRNGSSEREAFDAVVAADLGFDNVEKLNAHNRSVRAANRQSRAKAYNDMMNDPLTRDLLESIGKVMRTLR
jgi:hypothetical protein